jgi:hypothetical protein
MSDQVIAQAPEKPSTPVKQKEESPPQRPISSWAQIASAIIAGISASIAIGAIYMVYSQVTLIRENARIATARQVFMEYSQLGIQHPYLADPDYEKLKAGDPQEFLRYKLFVNLMLWAYDEMLLVYDDEEWQASFKADIKGHLLFLCKETEPEDYLTLSRKMRFLLFQARAASCRPQK